MSPRARVACETMVKTGMAVVAVPGGLTVGLDFSAASLVVGSLSDVGLDALGSLVGS